MNVLPQSEGVTARAEIMSHDGDNNSNGSHSRKINLTEARKILGVSPNKMSKLISDGTLRHETDPLDQRVKLVFLEDVQRLKSLSAKS